MQGHSGNQFNDLVDQCAKTAHFEFNHVEITPCLTTTYLRYFPKIYNIPMESNSRKFLTGISQFTNHLRWLKLG